MVDDNDVNRMLLSTFLEDWGFDCDEAPDGISAVKLFDFQGHSIIFMDIEMPRMNGIDAAKAIRALEGDSPRHVPIIFNTAYTDSGYEREVASILETDFVTKPLDFKRVRDLVSKRCPPSDGSDGAATP